MIKGKAKMEYGTGDIRMTGVFSHGTGALCCITQKIYINKVAEDYGIIVIKPWDGKFYFEKMEDGG